MNNTTNKNKYATSIQNIFILAVLLFWGIPFLKDILPQSDVNEIIQTCIAFVNPIFCIIISYMFFHNHNFTWYVPLGFALIFLPLPFLFYELGDLIYAFLYALASSLGWFLAFIVKHNGR